MRLLLLVCVQTIMITSGSCLRCETCQASGDCYGDRQQCLNNHVCLILRLRTLDIEKQEFTSEVRRQCWHSRACFQSGQVSSPLYKIQFITECCFEDNCKTPLPNLPAVNTKHNGLLCPACNSSSKQCVSKTAMKCIGEETACFTLNVASRPILTLSGCASPSYCSVHPLIGEVFRNNDNLIRPVKLSCQNAKRTSSLPVVNFLFCKECHGDNCDKVIRCSLEHNACLTILLQTTHGTVEYTEVTKRCGFSSECNSVGSITTGEKNISKNTTCCFEENCISPIPTLPLLNNETNGILCESCYYQTYGICTGQDYIACTGNATRCISYTMEQKHELEDFTSREVFHGCAHPAMCESGNRTEVDEYLTLKETVLCGIASKMTVHRPNLLYIYFIFMIYAIKIVYSFCHF